MMKTAIASLVFCAALLMSFAAHAGCCSHGCCDCGCIAAEKQQADLVERFYEIVKGYGYSATPVEISFPVEGLKESDELIGKPALVGDVSPLVRCEFKCFGNGTCSVSCQLD